MESGHTNFQGPSLGNGHYFFATKRLISNAPLNVSQFVPLISQCEGGRTFTKYIKYIYRPPS